MIILMAHRAGTVRWSYNAGAFKRLKGQLEGRKVWEIIDCHAEAARLKQAFAVASSLGEKGELSIALPDAPWYPDETTIVIEPVDEMVVLTLHRSFVRFKLTERENDVIRLICEGMSGAQIASALNICHATVETHRTHLYEKTGCSGTASLVRWAIRMSLIEP